MKKIDWTAVRDYDHADMLYADRKMLKWQGYLLSDHNQALAYEAWEGLKQKSAEASEEQKELWDQKMVLGKKLQVTVRRFLEEDRILQGTLVHINNSFFVLSDHHGRYQIYFEEVCELKD